jgi:acyl carrier protein
MATVQTETKSTIKDFISDYFIKDSAIEWHDDASFIEEGIIDSTGVMELVAFLEVSFGFRVEDEEISPEFLDSINKLVTYVESKLTKNDSHELFKE